LHKSGFNHTPVFGRIIDFWQEKYHSSSPTVLKWSHTIIQMQWYHKAKLTTVEFRQVEHEICNSMIEDDKPKVFTLHTLVHVMDWDHAKYDAMWLCGIWEENK